MIPAIKVAIFDKLYLPLPPTPNSRAFPNGYLNIRVILEICSQASKNRTNFIAFFPVIPANPGS